MWSVLRTVNRSVVVTQQELMDIPITIRRATLKDKTAVLDIATALHQGLDYLPSYYDNIVGHNLSTAYVVECGGKIVSFSVFWLVDGGKTAVYRGNRTHPKYLGRRYMKQIRDIYRKEHPEPVLACSMRNGVFNPENTSLRIVMTRTTLWFGPIHINKARTQESPKPLSEVTDTMLNLYISDKTISQYLFPKLRIVLDRVQFQLLPENIPLLRQTGGEVHMLTDVGVQGQNIVGLFSSSSWYSQGGVAVCKLDVFGRDTSSIQQHVSAHLDFGRPFIPHGGCIRLNIETDPEIDCQETVELMNKMGIQRYDWIEDNGNHNTYRLVCERNDV